MYMHVLLGAANKKMCCQLSDSETNCLLVANWLAIAEILNFSCNSWLACSHSFVKDSQVFNRELH